MPAFSPPHCALYIPALWPEIDGNEEESLARSHMDQPWLSLVSKSPFLSEVVQEGHLVPHPLPSSSSPSSSRHAPFTQDSLLPHRMCSPWLEAAPRPQLESWLPAVLRNMSKNHLSLLLNTAEIPGMEGPVEETAPSLPLTPMPASGREVKQGTLSGDRIQLSSWLHSSKPVPKAVWPLFPAKKWHGCLHHTSHLGQAGP